MARTQAAGELGVLNWSVRGTRAFTGGAEARFPQDGVGTEEVIPMSSSTQPRQGLGHETAGQEPVGELVQRASQQLTELVRGELRLAQAEMKEKGRKYGKGGGLFGGAGLVGFLMLQALVSTVIAALAVALPVWAAGLIVTVVLAVVAGVMALTGKKKFAEAAPPAPEATIENVKADVAEIKESAHR